MRKEIIAFCAACAALVSSAFTPTPAYTNTWTEDGITYSQLGGVKNSNAVVTAVNPSAVGGVRSVNGKTGHVVLDAGDVGAVRTVNGKDGTNIVLNAADVHALPDTYTPPAETDPVWANDRPSYVKWTNPNHNALTIGTRRTDGRVGENSFVNGQSALAGAPFSHAEGAYTIASGNFSHAEGYYSEATGYYTHAEGGNTHAEGDSTHAEGNATTALGFASHAEGGETTAGKSSQVDGMYAHAAGFNANARSTTSFTWNGSRFNHPSSKSSSAEYVPPYSDHGNGTYNINPVGGLAGLWVGNTNMADHITNLSRGQVQPVPVQSVNGMTGEVQLAASDVGAVPTSRTINGQPLTEDITIQTMPDNGLVLSQDGKIRTSNQQTQIIPSHIGAASSQAVEGIQAIVQTWEGFLDGSNVVFSITNYISNTYNLKAAKLRILEMRDGEYREVYNSRDEIILHLADFETNKLIVATNAVMSGVDAKVASKAPLAWGRVSSMGTPVEEGMVIINEPQTMFAGGTDWHRVALGEGSVCVLKTAGAPTYTAGDEGVFKFQDDGGTNYFGFAKTDSYTIGCNTDGITVQQQIVTLQYDITGATPCIWYKEHINTDEPWEQLNLPDGSPVSGASHLVQWRPDAGSGTRYCDINCQEGSGFFKATVEMSGSAKFITNMPADFSAGILCTDGIHKVAVDWNNGNLRLVEVQ